MASSGLRSAPGFHSASATTRPNSKGASSCRSGAPVPDDTVSDGKMLDGVELDDDGKMLNGVKLDDGGKMLNGVELDDDGTLLDCSMPGGEPSPAW